MHCIFSIDLIFFLNIGSSVSDVRVNLQPAVTTLYLASEVFSNFLCGEISDQRICLKFCVKNGIKCSEAFKMLRKAFGDNAVSHPRAYE